MHGLLLLALVGAGDVTWHQDHPGRYRIGLSGGIDDRSVSAADRKLMLAGLDSWVAFFKKQLEPKGTDVLINKGARGGSKVKDGPYIQNIDVMLFRYTSSPRWQNRVIPEDETGRTLTVNINSVHPLGDSLAKIGESEKGGALFLQPESGTRHGFTEFVVSKTQRALLLAAPGIGLFVPVSRRDLQGSLKKQYEEALSKLRTAAERARSERLQQAIAAAEAQLQKFEADHAALSPEELDAQAMAIVAMSPWPGLQPARGKPVVKYNPQFFKTRGKRTAPHFAMVEWKCSHMQPEDFPWMEALVERLDWETLAGQLQP